MQADAEHPAAQKNGKSQPVHQRHIERRRAIGEPDIAPARLLPGFQEARDFGDERILHPRRRAHGQRLSQQQRACSQWRARRHRNGFAFARDKRDIDLAAALFDHAVDGRAVAGGKQQPIAGCNVARRDDLCPSVRADARCRHGLHRGEIERGGARPAPEQMIEIAPDQQEEGQADRRIEICVAAALQRFRHAQAQRQQDPKRDRHIHVRAAARQACECRAKERPARVKRGGNGDQPRQPVDQRARALTHLAVEPGPHRDRKKHHVRCREPRDRQAAQQKASFGIVLAQHRRRVVGKRLEAEFADARDDRVGGRARAPPAHAQLRGGKVHACVFDAGHCRHAALDLRDASGAAHAFDREFQPRRALRVLAHERRGVDGDPLRERRGRHFNTTRRSASNARPSSAAARAITSHCPAAISRTLAR